MHSCVSLPLRIDGNSRMPFILTSGNCIKMVIIFIKGDHIKSKGR